MCYNIKTMFLLLGLMLPVAKCMACGYNSTEGHSNIEINERNVTSAPKGASIRASICGHSLLVVFTENLGGVDVEITTATGDLVQTLWVASPDGLQTYLPLCGDYVITFTLSNGDEYYGEFTVTD